MMAAPHRPWRVGKEIALLNNIRLGPVKKKRATTCTESLEKFYSYPENFARTIVFFFFLDQDVVVINIKD